MELLTILNSWWKDKSVGPTLALPYKRQIFPELKKLQSRKQITVISGLRRVGKSTLIYQLINELLSSKIKPENILYFSFDERAEDLLGILKSYSELTGVDWQKEKCFIFFDEIQKLSDWSNKVKIIYDRFPNLKVVISGSSSFKLEKDAKVNLAGRHFVLYVPPLTFTEYLDLKKTKIDLSKLKLWEDEIKKEFKNYLLRPFPEIVDFEELSLIKSYIKDNVIEKILKVDLTKKFKNVNEELLSKLIDIIYGNSGIYLNYDDISKDLKISKKTLLQHIYYLEFAYVIRKVKNFRPGTKTTSRKMQRAYPYHWSLGFGWNGNINFESIVMSFYDGRYYWREDEKEVDLLLVKEKVIQPIEVKESNSVDKNDLKPLIFFMNKFNIKDGILVYNGTEGNLEINKLMIKKLPIWKLFLTEKY